jgi:hypothetical protein
VRPLNDDRMRIVTEGGMNTFRSVVRDYGHIGKLSSWKKRC